MQVQIVAKRWNQSADSLKTYRKPAAFNCCVKMDKHGHPQKFFQVGAKLTFCLTFSGCWQCSANGHSQNALPFLHYKKYPMLQQQSQKWCFVAAAIFIFHSFLFSHSIKLRGLLLSVVTVLLHYLPKMCMFNSHRQQNQWCQMVAM